MHHPQPPVPSLFTSRPALRLSDCYWFFVPLVLMVELNMISKSAIHAFLARTDDPSVALAAFNAAFTFYFAITSATEITALVCLSYLRSRTDAVRVISFMAAILALPFTLALAVALTPLGTELFGNWFSLSPKGQAEARTSVGLLALSVPVLIMRGTAFALLMRNRRTIIITVSTFVRLASLALSFVVLPLWFEGAAIGAGALLCCMACETIFAWFFAYRYLIDLPAERPPTASHAHGGGTSESNRGHWLGYWRFSWPLIINTSAEMGVILTISLFLGRLANAEIAIAAFGVVHGLIGLLMGPMRNLTQSAQALIAERGDVRTMFIFSGQLIAFFTIVALILFNTSLLDGILMGIMGLTPELAAYARPAMSIAFTMAAFWSASALFRGLLANARTTGSLAASGVLRIATAAAAGFVGLAYPEINGALLGVGAWILSSAVETAISAWRLTLLGWYVEADAQADKGASRSVPH